MAKQIRIKKGTSGELPTKTEKKDGDYVVGYKKPPKEHQFSSTNQPPVNGGHAKGYVHFKTAVLKFLQQEIKKDKKGSTEPMDVLAWRLVEMCLKPTFNGRKVSFNQRLDAMKTLLDRVEGRPNVFVEVSQEKVIANLEWIAGDGVEDIDFETVDGDES